jgi:nucleotide-binding universal stress UspA family protein
MTAKILVPVDFSSITPAVVSWAASLARDRKASLILLHVQEPVGDNYAGEMYWPVPHVENPNVRRALLEVEPEDPTIIRKHRLELGAAPETILDVAADEQVDLIVMGSHGRGWLGRLLMGSVAEQVLRRSICPVLVVKPPCIPAEESPPMPAANGTAKETSKRPEISVQTNPVR